MNILESLETKRGKKDELKLLMRSFSTAALCLLTFALKCVFHLIALNLASLSLDDERAPWAVSWAWMSLLIDQS